MTALEELRENLREAAQRDIEANRDRSRRRHRRTTGLAVLALLGGAAAASATDLISVGEPLHRPANRTTAYAPDGATQMQVALTATSGAELPYGVVTYTARNGERCAVPATSEAPRSASSRAASSGRTPPTTPAHAARARGCSTTRS